MSCGSYDTVGTPLTWAHATRGNNVVYIMCEDHTHPRPALTWRAVTNVRTRSSVAFGGHTTHAFQASLQYHKRVIGSRVCGLVRHDGVSRRLFDALMMAHIPVSGDAPRSSDAEAASIPELADPAICNHQATRQEDGPIQC